LVSACLLATFATTASAAYILPAQTAVRPPAPELHAHAARASRFFSFRSIAAQIDNQVIANLLNNAAKYQDVGGYIGVSIGTPGVVSNFNIYQTVAGTVVSTVTEDVFSTTPDTMFRWDPTAQQWIFNINNKGYAANQTYFFRITLNDGTFINFHYGLK